MTRDSVAHRLYDQLQKLIGAGLLCLGEGCHISPYAIFDPADILGEERGIIVGDGARIGHGAVLYGGTTVGAQVVIEEHVVLGKPEYGYAIGHEYPGKGAETELGSEVVLRSGSIVYAGCRLGAQTTIGHHTTLRSHVSVGSRSQLAHRMNVERGCRIGHGVRCSPGSHITSEVVMEDGVFIGAGVITVNDKDMIWRDPQQPPTLLAPYFEQGAKVGSGSSIAAGVRVGREALVGMGSVVTRDVPDYAIVYGVPAQVRGRVEGAPTG